MDNESIARLQSLMQALFSQDLSWQWKGVFAAWAQFPVTQKETKCPQNLDWLIFSGFRLSWWLSLIISFFSFRFNQRKNLGQSRIELEANCLQDAFANFDKKRNGMVSTKVSPRVSKKLSLSLSFIGNNSSPSQIKYSPFPICAQLYTSRVWDKLLLLYPKKKTFSRSIHFSVLLEKTQARQKCRCF